MPEWPGHGAKPMDSKKGTDTDQWAGSASVFTKQCFLFEGDTVRAVELCFAAFVMAAGVMGALKKRRWGKKRRTT